MAVKCITDVDLDKHYFSTSANEIDQIINPLKRHEITYFSYSRLHPNGVDDCLVSNPAAQKIFVDNSYYKHVFVGEVGSYSPCIVRWDDLAIENEVIAEYMAAMRSNLNIGNGIAIVMPNDNVVEFYYFASTANNYKINSFFMSNIDFLYAFINYFNEVAKEIKEESYKNRVYYPGHGDKTIMTSCNFSEDSNWTTSQENTFNMMANYFRLSNREKECALFVMRGLNCKRISNRLNLSSRTVEKHLKNLRDKTNSSNFAQMVTKLFNINQFIKNI